MLRGSTKIKKKISFINMKKNKRKMEKTIGSGELELTGG